MIHGAPGGTSVDRIIGYPRMLLMQYDPWISKTIGRVAPRLGGKRRTRHESRGSHAKWSSALGFQRLIDPGLDLGLPSVMAFLEATPRF